MKREAYLFNLVMREIRCKYFGLKKIQTQEQEIHAQISDLGSVASPCSLSLGQPGCRFNAIHAPSTTPHTARPWPEEMFREAGKMPHSWTAGAPRKEPEQRARGSASGASRITQDASMFYHKSCTRTGKGPVKIPQNCPWLQAGVCVCDLGLLWCWIR